MINPAYKIAYNFNLAAVVNGVVPTYDILEPRARDVTTYQVALIVPPGGKKRKD